MSEAPTPKDQSSPQSGSVSRLVRELSQRNVFKVAAVYAISGWMIIQLANNIFPAFDFPQWTYQFVIILTLIGFPIAVAFAWAFEITPEGLKKSSEVMPHESITSQTGKKLNTLLIGSLSVLLVFMLIERVFFLDAPEQVQSTSPELVDVSATDPATASVEEPGAQSVSEKSIAVLPFDDFNAGGEEAYFADGLTEEILNALARTPDLLVASRTSSFEYKDQTPNIQDVAATLGVAHILEGSVRRSNTRLRVTAQLIRASDGFHLWSENYDRQPDDIIEVQEDVAFSIATALETAMDPQALREMVQSGTRSVPAYNAYLKGLSAREETGGRAANTFFEQARELDPGFAAAHFAAAGYWRNQMTPSQVRFEEPASESPEQMFALYQERISQAIATAAVPAQYLYRAEQARVNMQLRAALGFLQQYLREQGNQSAVQELLESAMYLAVTLGEREFALQLIEAIRSSSLSVAGDYSTIIQAYWRTGEYEIGYPVALEAVERFPNDENVLYQAHRFLLWAGYVEDARSVAERITGTELPLSNVLLMRLRQACAEGNNAEATRIFENELKPLEDGADFIVLHTLGRKDEANALLLPLDQSNSLYSLSAYLDYPFFDPAAFPNMQRMLEREQINRPAPRPIPFACEA